MRARTLALGSLLGLSLIASAALAGGHVDIKASAFPKSVQAGKALDVAFAMSNPNGAPVLDAKPIVVAQSGRTKIEFPASAGKTAGSYVAQVSVPKTGNWSFVIDSRICGNTCTLSKNTSVMAAAVTK